MRVCVYVYEHMCVRLHACVCVLVRVLMHCKWPSAPDEVGKGLGPGGRVKLQFRAQGSWPSSGPSAAGTQFYPGAGGDTHFCPLPTPSSKASFRLLVGLLALLQEAPALG